MVEADRTRTAVYAAEDAAFAGTDLEEVVPFGTLAVRADAVLTGPWWAGPPVELRRARRDSSTSTARCTGDGVTIRIARDQSTLATLAHELGHALAGADHGHDDLFRAAYLDTIATITNTVSTDRRFDLHVDQLAEAFAAAGLGVGARRWPEPEQGGAIAL